MRIAIDFDGVIALNNTTDYNVEVMMRQPTKGAHAFLHELLRDPSNTVTIFSCRARDNSGCQVIRDYLTFVVGLSYTEMYAIDITSDKPIADIYIDDHGFRFEGTWPSMDELKALAPNWLGRTVTDR